MWNEATDRLEAALKSHPEQLLEQLQAQRDEGTSEEQAMEILRARMQERLCKIELKKTQGNFVKAAQRLCNQAGIGPTANTKPGNHLPKGHPALEKVVNYIRLLRTTQEVHPFLVANFDQVWSSLVPEPPTDWCYTPTKGAQ